MFANNSEFFDSQHGQSVIVRQPPQQQPSTDEEFGSPFPVGGSSCLPSTPLTPGYSSYSGQFPFPFLPPEFAQTFQSIFPPPDHGCNPALGNLNIPGATLGGGLNHLNNRFGGVSRSNLPYDFPGSAANFMGGAKPRKGGRRPGDEMVSEEIDPEEMEKRLKRRQRNKEAAARCRQRRLDLMQTLQEQVNQERERNNQKEKEIAAIRQNVEKLVESLRGHLCHLPESDRIKFEEIVSNLHKDVNTNTNGHIFKIEPADPPVNDYFPNRVGSKRPALPTVTNISILEPEPKIPKFNDPMNTTLAQVNAAIEEVTRPTTLNINDMPIRHGPSAATPSNGLITGGSYSLPSFAREPLFGNHPFGDGANFLLGNHTGLTPSAAPTVGFVAQTPTPLQTEESNLRPL